MKRRAARRHRACSTASRSSPADRAALLRSARCWSTARSRTRSGLSRMRLGYTAGEAIGPDIFDFYRSLGLNLKQLYGMTETSVFICMQPDGAGQGRHGRRRRRPASRSGSTRIGEVLVPEPRRVHRLLQEPTRRRPRPRRRTAGCTPAMPGFFDQRRPSQDHRPRQGCRPPDRRHAVRAEIPREQAQVLPLHQGGGRVRRRPRPRRGIHQHRPRGRRQLGRAPRPALCELSGARRQARGLRADPGLRRAGQPRPRRRTPSSPARRSSAS